jgi:hypothetical protein
MWCLRTQGRGQEKGAVWHGEKLTGRTTLLVSMDFHVFLGFLEYFLGKGADEQATARIADDAAKETDD